MDPSLFLLAAIGAWSPAGTEHGCAFFVGATDARGITPVRAECEWVVDAARLTAVVSQMGNHDTIFSSLADSAVLSTAGGVQRIYQRQSATLAPDREVVLDVTTEALPDGTRVRFRKSANQAGLKGDAVEVGFQEGMWEVHRTAGGARLVYELRYLPGGMVPAAVLKWFQGAGTRAVLADLKAHLGAR